MAVTELPVAAQSAVQAEQLTRRARVARAESETLTAPVIYLYLLWAVIMFDPHRFLGTVGPGIFHRTLSIMFVPLLIMMALRGPMMIGTVRAMYWHIPFLIYLVGASVTIPFAHNIGYARDTVQNIFLYYVLALGTLAFVRTPRQVMPIILMFFYQYVWWAVNARLSGRVSWHPGYSNPDGYSPLMVMGLAITFYFALAAKKKWMRNLGFLLAGYCVLGVVAAFARGSVLSLGALAFILWVRSPRKVLTGAGLTLAMIIVLAGSAFLFPNGAFWTEMRTAFTEGTKEGTGRDRWELWKAAYEVFGERPFFGVWAGNFGPFAAEHFGTDDVFGYSNPGRLYNRNLHSIYLQVLSEFGAVGALLFILLIYDFWKRNRALRDPQSVETWAARTGGDLDLRYIALGFELAMAGYLLTGFFYAQLYAPWLYVLLGANAALYAIVSAAGGIPVAERARKGRPRRKRGNGARSPGRALPSGQRRNR